MGERRQRASLLRDFETTKLTEANFCALKGITRGTIFDIAKELNIPIREADMTRYDVWVSDECFLTGSGAEVIPVTKLDGRVIGAGKPGPITQKVLASFRRRVLVEGTRI